MRSRCRKPSPGTAAGTYQRAYEKRQVDAGARRLGGLLPAAGVKARDRLLAAGYAPSGAAVIAAALVETAARHGRSAKTSTKSTR